MNIVLVGMRGSGKSTIGMKLAEALTWPLVETDSQIEEKMQKPIVDIVRESGWEVFRSLENEVVRDVAQLDNVVISTGGGILLNDENKRLLKENGIIIYLTASIDSLFQRISNDESRPFLSDAKSMRDDIEKTFAKRESLYLQSSNFSIKTDTQTIEQTVEAIRKYVKRWGIIW
jgi:shikimate kinase